MVGRSSSRVYPVIWITTRAGKRRRETVTYKQNLRRQRWEVWALGQVKGCTSDSQASSRWRNRLECRRRLHRCIDTGSSRVQRPLSDQYCPSSLEIIDINSKTDRVSRSVKFMDSRLSYFSRLASCISLVIVYSLCLLIYLSGAWWPNLFFLLRAVHSLSSLNDIYWQILWKRIRERFLPLQRLIFNLETVCFSMK